MKKTVLTSFTILCLLFTIFPIGLTLVIQPVRAEIKTWTVDDDGPADFQTIQEAINNANEDDIIHVYSGTYYENVVVNKSLTLIGENRNSTVIDGNRAVHVVDVISNNVTMTGFTIRNSETQQLPPSCGVYVSSSYNDITHNSITDNYHGIFLDQHSSYTSVSENEIVNNERDGILLYRSSHNNISKNNLTANDYRGIDLEYSSNYNAISGNTITANGEHGVVILEASGYNNISGNSIRANKKDGILFQSSSYNEISGNTITANYEEGIDFFNSHGNSVYRNLLTNNDEGIEIQSSRFNRFYHNNLINNTRHVYDVGWDSPYESPSLNTWDDGYPSGGNYWSNYTGVDSDHDGIGDTIHVIDDYGNQDNYPLMGFFSDFNATSEYDVQTICNSTISDFQFNGTAISFNVTGEDGTTGFCRICIPTALMNDTFRVFVNGTEILPSPEPLPCSNSTHNYLYFTYSHSTHKVVIASEPPTISILSPENKTYGVKDVSLTFIVSESTSWIGYSLDGQANVTITQNTTLTELSDGAHSLIVCASDIAGNIGYSDMVYFTIDTTPPSISIASPENKTYATTDIPLTFTVDESVSWMAYSLNGQANMTISGNTTLSGLSEGSHSLTVYAEDTTGNTGASEKIYFTVETQPSPLWMQWWFWVAVVLAALAIAGIAYFLKKR